MNEMQLNIMKGMVAILNEASEAYYNSGNPIMTDAQFDARLKDLKELEEETGFVFANSPTHSVGAKVLTELQEIAHNHPMLSLEKVHTFEELLKFTNDKEFVASIKLDGLTVSLKYENGFLVSAETRGDGYVGSDITEHIRRFKNVPLKISKEGVYIVDGEAIITDDDFNEVNKDGEYKNSRNLASGTLSVLDTSLVAKRRLRFVAWDIIEGGTNSLKDNLSEAKELGFEVVPFWYATTLSEKKFQNTVDYVFNYAKEEGLPCDGIVFKFNDIEYGKSLGATSHHFKNGVAYKKEDDTHRTKLIDIEYTMGKTGTLTPTAVFESVEIDGTTVERASVHNISILNKLDLHIGDTIEVYKANMIIPQVKRNVSADERKALGIEPDYIMIPPICPICEGETKLLKENDSTVLVCTNDNCKGKLLGKLSHFVSKDAINIDGLSEQTLEKFVEKGYISSYSDIYELKSRFYDEIIKLDGFGKKSVDKLMNAIENSKTTTLDRFIYSLSIPLIGQSASKTIAKYCDYDVMNFINSYAKDIDWTILNDFGQTMNDSLKDYIANNSSEIVDLCNYLTFIRPTTNNNDRLNGKVFCITGSLNHFANRDDVKDKIESAGGTVSSSVSANTDYLICNEKSNSSKYKKAVSIGVNIVTEDELIEMLK